jgi:hypothetical protein
MGAYETWQSLLENPADAEAADAYAVKHRAEIGERLAQAAAPKPPTAYEVWQTMRQSKPWTADDYYERNFLAINREIEARRRGQR